MTNEARRADEGRPAQEKQNRHDSLGFAAADLISTEAVVNMLIRKGICTAEDLYDEERRLQQEAREFNSDTHFVDIPSMHESGLVPPNRRRRSWLKRKMAKRRWTRRLGTQLFGWEWKKVKVKVKGKAN